MQDAVIITAEVAIAEVVIVAVEVAEVADHKPDNIYSSI